MTSSKKHYTIGTGSIDATYYSVGRAICEIINKQSLDFTCEAISTAGSVYNLKSIRNKAHDFGISQSIVQYRAFEGIDEFEMDGKNDDLRMITPLHTEIMIIAAKKGSWIKSFSDLKRNRVNIANAGSGTRTIIEKLLAHKNIDHQYFSEIHEYKSGELPDLFRNNKIDAAIYPQ
ncbi:MAG: TAXI family TRAP transporter solute-binding subunit [Pseudomonadota bacterium]